MMTVRSPTGFSIQYNAATYAVRKDGYTDLYTNSNKTDWIAQVPNSWVIEVARPCRVYDAANNPEGLAEDFLAALHSRRISVYRLADIKKALRDFDALRKRWK